MKGANDGQRGAEVSFECFDRCLCILVAAGLGVGAEEHAGVERCGRAGRRREQRSDERTREKDECDELRD